jgi:hypothetical protein
MTNRQYILDPLAHGLHYGNSQECPLENVLAKMSLAFGPRTKGP